MKKNILLSFVFLVVGILSLQAQEYKIHHLNAEQILEKRGELIVRIYLDDFTKISELSKKVSIDNIDKDGNIIAFMSHRGYDYLVSTGMKYDLLYADSELYTYNMYSGGRDDYNFDAYPTYESYVEIMNQFQADYPDLCKVEVFGQSEQNRDLIVAKISDNVSQNEAEPEFFYTSTMHGDESTGYVLMLHLIDYLLSNYGTDDRVTNMVNNMEIYINPLANPDGTYHGGNNTVSGATRANANGVDLNRNYPDIEEGPHPDGLPYQAETNAFMSFADNHDFVLSANFHGGVEVVNYPWDTWAKLHADNDWFINISREYADTVHVNSPSGYMEYLVNGITNGFQWYTISGSRQDYMNYHKHCREITIELSDVKLLPESQLISHWNYNYRSFLNHIEEAGYGFRGIVKDAETNEPIEGAKVEIIGHDEDGSFVQSAKENGDFYRPIKAGTYDFTISAPCYAPVVKTVTISDYEYIEEEIALSFYDFNVNFTSDEQQITIGNQVNFNTDICGEYDSFEWTFEGGNPSSSTEENPTVQYDAAGEFDVTLTVIKDGESHVELKENYISVEAAYLMDNTTVTISNGIFYDHGGADANYSNDESYTMTFLPENSSGKVKANFVEFAVEPSSGCDYDWLKVFDGADVSAPEIGTYCGTNGPGVVEATNEQGALTFQFHSDYSASDAGWKALMSVEGGSILPVADFSIVEEEVIEGDQVHFVNESENAVSYHWYFEGGTPAESTDESPVVTYTTAGVYDVRLVVNSSTGNSNEMIKEDFIDVRPIGISETFEKSLKIYPNPLSNGLLHISGDRIVDEVVILDISGKVLKSVTPKQKNIHLNINDIQTGLYIIQVKSGNLKTSRKLDIIR